MRRVIIILVLLSVVALSRVTVVGAAPQIVTERYTSLDGLPNNYISDICFDKRGFVWLCTWYGLSRFDGYRFKNYLTLPGDNSPLSHNRFLRIDEDSNGYLWLTTYDQRLYRFDRGRELFEPVPAVDQQSGGSKLERYLCASTGEVWVALSGQGLVRCEIPIAGQGVEMTNYFHHKAVGRNISAIFEDSDHNIWILSEVGLARIDSQTQEPKLLVAGGNLSSLTQLGGYVALARAGTLLLVDRCSGVSKEVQVSSKDRITTLTASPQGSVLYVGTVHDGVGRYVLDRDVYERDGRFRGKVRMLHCDSKGTLWITSSQPGITRYDPTADNYKSFVQPINVVSYYVDSLTRVVERNDVLWVKMNRWGFGYYDRAADDIVRLDNHPTDNSHQMENGVICFDIDPSNVLWLSTQQRGLERISVIEPKTDIVRPATEINNRASSEIRAICVAANGDVWLANKSGELFCYDERWVLKDKFPNASSGRIGLVYSIMEDTGGNIWLGTKADGALRLSPRGGGYDIVRYKFDPNNIYSISGNAVYNIFEDSAGRIWFSIYGGAISMLADASSRSFLSPRNTFANFPLDKGSKMRYMAQMADGRVVGGSVEGLLVFDPNDDPAKMQFGLYHKIAGDKQSLGNNDIIHIMVDSSQSVWLSTYGGGLNRLTGFTPQGEPRFKVYSGESSGLLNNIVFASIEDSRGNIWVSGENGLAKLDMATERFVNYSRYDGVPTASFNEATVAATKRGKLLFGSTNNLYVIDPEKLSTNKEPCRLTFTSLWVGNMEVSPGDESPIESTMSLTHRVLLPHNYSLFRIDYASLNYKLQPAVRYSYKLEGYDKEWNEVGELRSASYSNVPSGSYTFCVRCEASGNSEQIQMPIIIRSAPWASWWAYTIYALLLLALFAFVFRILYSIIVLRQRIALEHGLTEHKLKFFTNISHELRTPLTIIMGGIEDIENNEQLSPRSAQSIALVSRNAKRMLGMINQLLDFRKIVKERMTIAVRRVDIVELGRSVVEDFREMACERKIELLFAFAQEHTWVWADPDAMVSVATNLLSNAFKFTPDGGRIEVRIGLRDNSYSIEVSDTGMGIPKDKQAHIFDRFTQFSKSATGMRGSGIGLSICREMVALHHGTISVESSSGVGTTFTVRLPLGSELFTEDELQGNGDDNVADYMVSDNVSSLINERVATELPEGAQSLLLVEDNDELRAFLFNQLSVRYRVTEAVDGADALQKVRQQQPELIVTDLMMPQMNGHQLVRSIRDDFATSHIPIIVLTAKSDAKTRIESMRNGADGYITKPFSVELLMTRIENLLSTRRHLFEKYSSATVSRRIVEIKPMEVAVTDRDEEFIISTMKWLDENVENSELTIETLASFMGLGRTTLYNKIKGLTGKSPVELIKDYRVDKAAMYLLAGGITISEAAYKVGFSDPGYFSKCFKEKYGSSPAEYVKQNAKKE